jgi:hypothetical protein
MRGLGYVPDPCLSFARNSKLSRISDGVPSAETFLFLEPEAEGKAGQGCL